MKVQVFDHIANKEHEQIVFCKDPTTGLRAIIAIHNRNLGPALGGCRMWNYTSEEAAVSDALRLSHGMTYKAAMANLALGGGKAVIIADPKLPHRYDLFRAFARFVHSLNGQYITAEDVGTTVPDMDIVRGVTPYVVGVSPSLGGSGDPSPFTAIGIHSGMKAAAKAAFGNASLHGVKIAMQGLGKVGSALIKLLAEEGAILTITDLDQERAKQVAEQFGCKAIAPELIYDAQVDIFSPNALGGILNDTTIPRLKAKVIAGGANNQLEDYSRHGEAILKKGMIYAPDYVLNGGGLINVSHEIKGYCEKAALQDCKNIYQTIETVLSFAKDAKITTFAAANHIAEKRIFACQECTCCK